MGPIKQVDNKLCLIYIYFLKLYVSCQQAPHIAIRWVLWFLLHLHTIEDVPFPASRT